MSPRLSPHSPEAMTPRQREIHDDIVSRRGRLGGPFPAWLRNPELAECAQRLGAYCRYDSNLTPQMSELAILVVARHWSASVEWAIHAPIAAKAGVPAKAIAAIRECTVPQFDDRASQVIHAYAAELLTTGRVTDAQHARAVEVIGERRVVDLVGLIGYYSLVALTLNAFDMPLPEGATDPFAASEGEGHRAQDAG